MHSMRRGRFRRIRSTTRQSSICGRKNSPQLRIARFESEAIKPSMLLLRFSEGLNDKWAHFFDDGQNKSILASAPRDGPVAERWCLP